MIPPTPSTAASSSRVAERIASSDPKYAASERAATGPTCRIESATRKRQSSFSFAFSSSTSSSSATADGPYSAGSPLRAGFTILRNGARDSGGPFSPSVSSAGLDVAHHDLDREQVVDGEREQPGLGLRAAGRGHGRLGERGRTDLAEPLDVQRAARSDVLDAPAHLRRAGPRVRAAQVDVALLRRGERRAALGADGRHDERALGAVAQLDDRPQHLGNHIAGFAQHDGVADQHALELDHVLVVEGRLPHGRPGDAHRLHDRERRRASGAADRDHDVEQLGVHLLGRVLVRDRPARRAAGRPELVVQGELVDLDDDAVDLMLDRSCRDARRSRR